MFKEIFKEMFHPSKAAIISSLKRSNGLPVSEVAQEVDMSYMGVKQHCINLEKMGFLESWHVPRKEVGRPEKLYRLTSKCDELFPVAGAEVSLEILEQSKELFGADAPVKMLESYFDKKQKAWEEELAAVDTIEAKIQTLSKLREDEGYFNSIEIADDNTLNLVEYHNPFESISEQYPIVKQFEQAMLEELVGVQVESALAEGTHGQNLTLYSVKHKKVA